MKRRERKQHALVPALLAMAIGTGMLFSCDSFSFYDLMDSNKLVISPEAITLLAYTQYAFTVSGGKAPYTFTNTGIGSIDAGGIYTAPGAASTDIVRVTDSRGAYREASITVQSVTALLQISPSSVKINFNDVLRLTASGGIAPYSFVIQSGPGSITVIDAVAGIVEFTPPPYVGKTVLVVTDNVSATASASIQIKKP